MHVFKHGTFSCLGTPFSCPCLGRDADRRPVLNPNLAVIDLLSILPFDIVILTGGFGDTSDSSSQQVPTSLPLARSVMTCPPGRPLALLRA